MNDLRVFLVLVVLLAISLYLLKLAFEDDRRHHAVMFSVFNGIISILMVIFLLIRFPLIVLSIIIYLVIIFLKGHKTYEKVVLKEINLTSSKVKEELKVAFIADFQFDIKDGIYNNGNFTTATEMLNNLDYDYLLLGGDYINYPSTVPLFKEDLEKMITKPTYAVHGNHDNVAKEEVTKMFEDLGVTVLENDYVELDDVVISGLADVWTGEPDYFAYEKDINQDKYHIFISHNPDYIKTVANVDSIDLALGGHYHNGQIQIFPGFSFVKLVAKYPYGLYTVNKFKLFVTSGLGGSFMRGKYGRYVRVFTPPEVVSINIKPEN